MASPLIVAQIEKIQKDPFNTKHIQDLGSVLLSEMYGSATDSDFKQFIELNKQLIENTLHLNVFNVQLISQMNMFAKMIDLGKETLAYKEKEFYQLLTILGKAYLTSTSNNTKKTQRWADIEEEEEEMEEVVAAIEKENKRFSWVPKSKRILQSQQSQSQSQQSQSQQSQSQQSQSQSQSQQSQQVQSQSSLQIKILEEIKKLYSSGNRPYPNVGWLKAIIRRNNTPKGLLSSAQTIGQNSRQDLFCQVLYRTVREAIDQKKKISGPVKMRMIFVVDIGIKDQQATKFIQMLVDWLSQQEDLIDERTQLGPTCTDYAFVEFEYPRAGKYRHLGISLEIPRECQKVAMFFNDKFSR